MQGRPGAAMGMADHMRAMDTNGDGLLSKQEFLKAHEAMFDRMKKNEQGQVAIASMGSMGGMDGMVMCPMMK
ncbi:EF-hand domain-containing protein [Ramlibacter sp. AN1015]|uniref:EF-hand domain-containing protein n=1 Tax=Ramlibacter sp. AN1015 TaxID=3133428 RepID=UPI0030C31A4B